MEPDIQIFTNEFFGSLRTIIVYGEPWFYAIDVANALGYYNSRDAINDHVDPQDKMLALINDGTRGNPHKIIINESGVYSLIFSSRMPNAIAFRRWVTSKVLPTMRQLGFDNSINILKDELNKLKSENERLTSDLNDYKYAMSSANRVNSMLGNMLLNSDIFRQVFNL